MASPVPTLGISRQTEIENEGIKKMNTTLESSLGNPFDKTVLVSCFEKTFCAKLQK